MTLKLYINKSKNSVALLFLLYTGLSSVMGWTTEAHDQAPSLYDIVRMGSGGSVQIAIMFSIDSIQTRSDKVTCGFTGIFLRLGLAVTQNGEGKSRVCLGTPSVSWSLYIQPCSHATENLQLLCCSNMIPVQDYLFTFYNFSIYKLIIRHAMCQVGCHILYYSSMILITAIFLFFL